MNLQLATTLTNATVTIKQIIGAITIALGIVWFVLGLGSFQSERVGMGYYHDIRCNICDI
jgi:hypothetical protein